MAGEPGVIYLIHFNTRYKHAGHYLGWTTDLGARLAAHSAGTGARLMEVIREAGITWRVARTWTGDRAYERKLKTWGVARNGRCPLCRGAAPIYAEQARPPEGFAVVPESFVVLLDAPSILG